MVDDYLRFGLGFRRVFEVHTIEVPEAGCRQCVCGLTGLDRHRQPLRVATVVVVVSVAALRKGDWLSDVRHQPSSPSIRKQVKSWELDIPHRQHDQLVSSALSAGPSMMILPAYDSLLIVLPAGALAYARRYSC